MHFCALGREMEPAQPSSASERNSSLFPVKNYRQFVPTQAAAAGMDVGGVAAMERHAELLQEEVRQSEARLRDMLSQGHPIA